MWDFRGNSSSDTENGYMIVTQSGNETFPNQDWD